MNKKNYSPTLNSFINEKTIAKVYKRKYPDQKERKKVSLKRRIFERNQDDSVKTNFFESNAYKVLFKLILWFIILTLCAAAFFGYAQICPIDEATDALLQTLHTLFVIFIAIAIIDVFLIALLIFLKVKENKIKYAHRNKSRLKSQIYAFDIVNFIWMTLFCIMCIYPIFYVFIGSFNQGADYAKGGVYLLPRLLTFENYKIVLKDSDLWHSYLITLLRTAIGTTSALVFTSIVAYAMSRNNLRGKKIFHWINLFTMFFGGGLVPFFLIIKSVGLYDSFWVYIIPALYSVYNMIVISTFFKSISNELHEAAVIDGAGEFRIWWQIYMPLSKPVLATVALWLAVGHWNAYIDTMIYTSSKSLHSLQYYLYKVITASTLTEGMPESMLQRVSSQTLSLAAIIISIIPVLFFFPFIRKNFQSGIMVGSLKG